MYVCMYVLLYPATLNLRKSSFFEWNVIRLLG